MPDNAGGAAGQSPGEGESGRAAGGHAGKADAGSDNAGEAGATGDAGSKNAAGGDAGSAGAAGDAGMANEAGAGGEAPVSTCAGCQIGAACVAADAKNPQNPCEICRVSVSRVAYSPNAGVNCGSEATECSSQDTCNANGACQKNDLSAGTICAIGACEAGVCLLNPFDCIVPSPPTAEYPNDVYSFTGAPPTAKGGVVADGKYVPTKIDFYGESPPGVDIYTFEFKKGFFVQAALRYFSADIPHIAYIPEVQFAGTVAASANALKFSLERCDPGYNIDLSNLTYTATANGMVTFRTVAGGTTVATSYVRQ